MDITLRPVDLVVIALRPPASERKGIGALSDALRGHEHIQNQAVDIHESLRKEIELLRSKDGYLYAGYPNFMALFGRDSLISSWQLLNYDPSIARSSLAALAKMQGKKVDYETAEEPGKILHEYWPETSREFYSTYKSDVKWLHMGVPVFYSVDSTPLFLIVLDKYFNKTHDVQFLREMWPSAVSAVAWMLKYGMHEDGFLKYDARPAEDGLPSQSWKDGAGNILEQITSPVAIVEVQGYFYAALLAAGRMARAVGAIDLDSQTNKIAAQLKSRFNDVFWNEDAKFYALAVDGDGKQIVTITSNPGQLLFSGIVDKGRADAIVERLLQPDMWTPYGIRTHSMLDRVFHPREYQLGAVWPHDNWVIAQGMDVMGHTDGYKKVSDGTLKARDETGTSAEHYGVSRSGKLIHAWRMKTRACVPQAWATGAGVDFLANRDRTSHRELAPL